MEFTLSKSWENKLKSELQKEYISDLKDFLEAESNAGKIIYPKPKEIFQALNELDFEKIKVVIIGQDPYHGEGQAHGMCFSVKPGVKIPPSLRNVYKEPYNDLNIEPPNHGYLLSWAKQGVLLLNNVLTVEKSLPHSHQKKGWEKLTDRIIQLINDDLENVIFLLWGAPAQKKAAKVDEAKHHILKAPHPSPLSAHRGFLGCGHFSLANDILKKLGKTEIKWDLPANV